MNEVSESMKLAESWRPVTLVAPDGVFKRSWTKESRA